MIKVFSIVFQSKTNPEQVGIFTTKDSETLEHAKEVGVNNLKSIRGDLDWTAIIANSLNLDAEMSKNDIAPMPQLPSVKIEEFVDKDAKLKESKNWLLKVILDNKDSVLFKAVKKYLTVPEVKLIEETIK